MSTATQTQFLAKKLMESGAFMPSTANGDFYNQVMPGGSINAPSMLAFAPQGQMTASGAAPMAAPVDGGAALQPAPGVMDASGMAAGAQPVASQANLVAAPPMPHPVPVEAPQTYVIRKGDTLTKIAKRLGTTVKALALANGIKNPNKIIAGRTLRIG